MGTKMKLALAAVLLALVTFASVTALGPQAAEPEPPAPEEVGAVPDEPVAPAGEEPPAVVPDSPTPDSPAPEQPKPVATLNGLLTDAEGVPVPRASVSVNSRKVAGRPYVRLFRGVTTDKAGRFTVKSLPAVPVKVLHHPRGVRPVEASVDLAPGANDVTLQLRPAEVLDVVVVDVSGRPFEKARLQMHDRKGVATSRYTGPDGKARFVLTRGFRDLIVLSYPRAGTEYVRVAIAELPETNPLRVVLREADPIEGVVVDAADKPIPGVFIDFLEDGRKLEYVLSDDEGRFRILAPRGASLALVAHGMRRQGGGKPHEDLFASGRIASVAAGTRDVVLTMKARSRNGRLTCELRGPNGIPMVGACVAVRSALVMSKLAEGTADSNGLVTFEDLPVGEVRLLAWDPKPVGQRQHWKGPRWSVVVPSGQTFVLKFREQVFVTGTLLDPDEKPVPGCRLHLMDAAGKTLAQVWTDEKGRFRAGTADDEPGPFRVVPFWKSPQGAEPDVSVEGVEPGTEGLIIVLPR